MNTRSKIVSGFLLWMLVATAAHAQNYSITWYTVDGGGSTSTNGVYTVSGTAGQPDAGTLSSGSFTLQGGFWGVVAAVQTPGAPWLTITQTATNSVVVSWPLPADGWVLEQVSALTGAGWSQVSSPYANDGSRAWLVVPAPTGNQFYRLKK
jgi:hypothetical protein